MTPGPLFKAPFWQAARRRRDAAWPALVPPDTREHRLDAGADHLDDLLATSPHRGRFEGREFRLILDQPDPFRSPMEAGGMAPEASVRIFTSRAEVGPETLPTVGDIIELRTAPAGEWQPYLVTAMPDLLEADDPGISIDLEPDNPNA